MGWVISDVGKRLNKFISDTGYCSRREADKLIGDGKVRVNGAVPELGTKIFPHDTVSKALSLNVMQLRCTFQQRYLNLV